MTEINAKISTDLPNFGQVPGFIDKHSYDIQRFLADVFPNKHAMLSYILLPGK